MKGIGVAIVGASGWMGKVHAISYQSAPLLFGTDRGIPEIRLIVDENTTKLEEIRAGFGAPRISSDWHDAIGDPEIDLVDICLPDFLHFEVAKAALETGKHVYCEKPLCDTSEQARELAELAAKAKVVTKVGHNFPKNPALWKAREMIRGGELGKVQMFRGSVQVDVLADPHAPFMWRCDGELAPTGVAGDMASHMFSIIDYLIGLDQIEEINCDAGVVTKMRPFKEGFGYGGTMDDVDEADMREVTNPDYVNLLLRFKGGGMGVLDISRVATGRKFHLSFDAHGSKGGLGFNHDEVNRLRYFSPTDAAGRQGWRAIDVGPEVPGYAAFSPLANLSVGYNDYKAIEVGEVIHSITTNEPSWPTFADGYRIMRFVDASLESSGKRKWLDMA